MTGDMHVQGRGNTSSRSIPNGAVKNSIGLLHHFKGIPRYATKPVRQEVQQQQKFEPLRLVITRISRLPDIVTRLCSTSSCSSGWAAAVTPSQGDAVIQLIPQLIQ